MPRFTLLSSAVLCCAILCFTAGCSSTSGGNNAFTIQTSASSVLPDGTLTFYANRTVTWSVAETDGGAISSGGVYSAPPFSGIYHIVATTVATPAQQASYAVTVTAQPPPNSFIAGPMADAAYENQPYGANLVLWPSLSSRVIAYLIYRDSNPNAPVAVVPGATTSYVDSATPLGAGNMLESTAWQIAIDPNLGTVLQFSPTVSYGTSLAQLGDANEQLGQDTFDITAQRVPLSAGQSCGYQICVLYIDYQQNGLGGQNGAGLPTEYTLVLGNLSAVSTRPTLTAPPALSAPVEGSVPSNGVYSCQTVPSATSYALQVSPDATFPENGTYSVLATGAGGSTAQATFSQANLESVFPNAAGKQIFWRMGARVGGSVLPFALSTPNTDGWVFSPMYTYQVPNAPPTPPTSSRRKS